MSFGSENKVSVSLLLVCILLSAVIGAVFATALISFLPKDNNTLIKEFYDVENAAKVSPSDYVGGINDGHSIGLLVDLRTSREYAAGHFVDSVNIPAPELSEAQLISAFVAMPKDKPIITYCYSSYCMLSANVGKFLADNGIFVKHMSAGWLEISQDYNSYVAIGAGFVDANLPANNLVCSASPNAVFKC